MACKGGTLSDGKDKFYPNAFYEVGDLFLTTRNENPSVRFGGAWELFGKGKTLVCVDENDNDFKTVKQTGGEKTHKLTIEEMPKHKHDGWGGTYGGGGPYYYNYYVYGNWNTDDSHKSVGGDKPHNNMQPYITCYIWIRIK